MQDLRMAWLHTKLATLYVAKALLTHFVIPVIAATAVSVQATLSLPHTIATAIREARESAKLDAELEAALIDPTFLDRAMLGVTEEESQTIKKLAKEL